jgi:hypothetical protein
LPEDLVSPGLKRNRVSENMKNMKGDVNMSGLKFKLRNRCKPLLSLPLVIAVIGLFWGGINVTSAGADQSEKQLKDIKNAHEYHAIRDTKVDPKLSPKERARVQRDAAIKNRENSRKFIQNIIAGKESASSQGGSAK